MESSMKDQSEISSPQTSPAIDSSTPSAALEFGHEPCVMLEFPTTPTCGVGAAPAKDSRKQGGVSALPTSATSGQNGSDSSPPVDLLYSLVSRFRARTDSRGSTLFVLTWKARTTPSGYLIPQLLASARRTADSVSTSWPTPVREDARSSARHGYMIEGNQGTTLLDAARLTAESPSSYPTPQAHDHASPKTSDQIEAMRSRAPKRLTGGPPGISNLNEVVRLMTPAPYPTPNASCGTRGGGISHMDGRRSNLIDTVKLMEPSSVKVMEPSSWATPASHEAGGTPERFLERKELARENGSKLGISLTSLSLQAQMTVPATDSSPEIASESTEIQDGVEPSVDTGPRTSSGSTADRSRGTKTGAGGQLNPVMSRWLMGLPPA